MGAAKKRPFYMIGSMLVRRVVRLGPKFVCGICRTHHKAPYEANNCLHACWRDVKSSASFVPVRRMNNIYYACIYCLRSYHTPDDAATCAADCNQTMFITDYSTNQLDRGRSPYSNDPVSNVIPIAKPTVKPAPAAVRQPTVLTVPSVPIEHSPPPVLNIAAAPLASAAAAEVPSDFLETEVKHRKGNRVKKFDRAGSKYVCEVCKEKYFTKTEVEACFDAHPD